MSVDEFVISFISLSMPWNSQEFWMSRTPSTFSLHLVFTSRISTALTEFANMFNNHRLSTEHEWTPNQIWLNGILNENNPLSSSGDVDESEVD